jgi:hypothetical protein
LTGERRHDIDEKLAGFYPRAWYSAAGIYDYTHEVVMKKKMVFVSALCFYATLFLSHSSGAEQKLNWKLVKSDGVYQTYTSEQPGSRFIASRCVTIMNARMDEIGMVLRDFANFSTWLQDCSTSKLLKTVDDEKDIFIFYLIQDVPILPDRDMVLKSNVVLNYQKGWCFVGVKSTNDFTYPTPKGMVRMLFDGSFLLEYIDKDHTRVTYTIVPDLGGRVPGMMANPIIKDLPRKSLMKMKVRVAMPQYIESAKKSKYRKMIDEAVKKGYIKG